MKSFARRIISAVSIGLVLTIALPLPGRAKTAPDGINWAAYQDMAVDLMQQYLRVNTSNPPGNELAAAQFLKLILDRESIPNEIFEFQPGRANIIARLKGSGAKRPFILLSHMDVVTPTRRSGGPIRSPGK
jgi:hypothetical protein